MARLRSRFFLRKKNLGRTGMSFCSAFRQFADFFVKLPNRFMHIRQNCRRVFPTSAAFFDALRKRTLSAPCRPITAGYTAQRAFSVSPYHDFRYRRAEKMAANLKTLDQSSVCFDHLHAVLELYSN